MTTVRALRPADHDRWRALFAAYREFYRLTADDAVPDRVWRWLLDAGHEVTGLVAELDGQVVGLAHHRPVCDPSTGSVDTWLDDLFVDPAARAHGVGEALLAGLPAGATTSWITASDNATARRLYDRVAHRTDWVVYEAPPVHTGGGSSVRALVADDEQRWRELYAAYRDFYRLAPDDAVLDRVWGWLLDPGHELTGLVAEPDGEVIGLAHCRAFSRPSTGTVGLWLDDLFTDPAGRGRGVGRALLSRVAGLAGERGCSLVRWVTAADNRTARQLYDDVATATAWVVYEASPT